jgi:hypothetical protein
MANSFLASEFVCRFFFSYSERGTIHSFKNKTLTPEMLRKVKTEYNFSTGKNPTETTHW